MGPIDFLSALPLWLLAIVLNACLMGIGLAGLWIARRWILPRLQLTYDDAYFAAAVVQSAMLLYSLIAALTAVGVWQRYAHVSDVVSGEATAIATLWRDLDGYPQPVREAAQGILRGYTQQVINEAWPQQREGQVPRAGVEWMDRLQAQLFAFEPATESQRILHSQTLSAFSELIQERRQRLDSVQGGLPAVLWWLLLPGAAGCVLLFVFFHLTNPRYHEVLVVVLAGFLAMVLFVIIALDRPYRGDAGIGPDSYQLVYDHQMRR